MPKQSLEFRIELSGLDEPTLEKRKLDLLVGLATVIKTVQENSSKGDTHPIKIKSSFASNMDLFSDLPNNLEFKSTETNKTEN